MGSFFLSLTNIIPLSLHFSESGFKIQWVDDTHALGIFSSLSTGRVTWFMFNGTMELLRSLIIHSAPALTCVELVCQGQSWFVVMFFPHASNLKGFSSWRSWNSVVGVEMLLCQSSRFVTGLDGHQGTSCIESDSCCVSSNESVLLLQVYSSFN